LNGNGAADDLPPYSPVPQSMLTQLGNKYKNTAPLNWPYTWYWAGYFPMGLGPDGRPGKAGIDDNADGVIDDAGEIGAPGSDDFLPLSAIQIKITFYDTTSKQLREMTFVHSLLDTE